MASLAIDERVSDVTGSRSTGLLMVDGSAVPAKFHPLADLFPLLEGAEFDALVGDVRDNGVRRPVVLHDGMILDGRNRYLAAREAGVGYSVVEFDGSDPVSYVVSENLRRRHLSESQKSTVAAKLAKLQQGRPTVRAANLPVIPTQAQAAEMLNVSERSVRSARAVIDHGTPKLLTLVETDQVAVSAAAEVAKLPVEEQAEIVEQGPAAVREAAKDIRETGHVNRTSFTGNNEWFTPAEHVERARDVLGGFDLDPASNALAQETVKAERFFTVDDDGLAQDWDGRVWLNPPYAQPAIGQFIDKLLTELDAGRVSEAIMLTHNYTDTAWFQKAAGAAAAICFTRGRVRFVSPSGELAAPTQGQAFFYFGADPAIFYERFQHVGFLAEVIP